MDGVGTDRGLWRNLKQRWRLNGIGCCGSEWALGPANLSFREQQQQQDHPPSPIRESISVAAADGSQITPRASSDLPCLGQILAATAATNASSAINLATALAAERIPRTTLRTAMETASMTPLRSLMGWIEDTDGGEDVVRREMEERGDDRVCCVCMERNKGAAFIPCGHTYCRICSRELWLDRGACPLCNRPITEVLDIF